MAEPGYNAVVLRVGELFLKKDNRRWFVDLLVGNLARLIRGLPWKIEVHQGRILLLPQAGSDPAATVPEVLARAGRCFGISSLSPVVRTDSTDPTVLGGLAAELAEATVPPTAKTFRVTARRPNKRLPYTSPELGGLVGHQVGQRLGLAVDLGRPEFEIGGEAGPPTFVYSETRPGAGGLPVGASGRGLLLLSGGIDSPVAGHRMLRRGCPLEVVHFHSPPYTGPAARAKVLELCQVLARWAGPLHLHLIPISELQLQVKEHAPRPLTVLLYRRFMVRLACRLAGFRQIQALITGESLGQVASQTMENLTCIEAVADRPILRPLIAYDKEETIRLAQAIGSYEISIRPHEDSCSLFVPRHPEIRAKIKELNRAEALLPLDRLLAEALDRLETLVVEP